MKKRYYILITLLAYLFFTLGNIPAAKVVSLVESNSQLPARLYGVQGSLWEGSADRLVMRGRSAMKNIPIDNIQWSLNPASLLLASLSAEVKASISKQNVIGSLRIGPSGSLSASDIRARIDATVIQELIQLPIGELAGTLNLNIQSLELLDGGLPVTEGEVRWKQAKLTVLETVDLGNILLSLKPGKEQQIIARLSNQKGQITIKGKLTVEQNKTYDLDLSLTPQDNATQNIRQSLAMFARRQSDGSYLLKRKGKLSEVGL